MKMIQRGKANKEMRSLLAKDPAYAENPLIKERLGLARTLLNARMPGAVAAERNIYSSGANAFANTSAAATDSSQLLAKAGDIQGNQNEAFNQLGQAEAGDYQRRYGNVVNAQDAMVNEGDKMFQDKLRHYYNEVQTKGAINENKQNNWGEVTNVGFGLANLALSAFGAGGGGGGMMGQGGGGNRTGGGQIQTWNQPITNWSQLQGNVNIDPRLINSTNRPFGG
jgi:hypothetical protein